MNEKNKTENRKTKNYTLRIIISVILIIIILGWIILEFTPYILRVRREFRCIDCTDHFHRHLGKAIYAYTAEYNGHLPTADSWCDLLTKYVDPADEAFKCPEVKEGRCNFAINKYVAGMKLSEIPSDVVLLFEAKPGWNQVGGPELLATENHEGKSCSIMFGNLSSTFAKKKPFIPDLRWEP